MLDRGECLKKVQASLPKERRLVRFVNAEKNILGGVALATAASSAALRELGWEVTEFYADELVPACTPQKLKRLILPWVVALKLRRTHSQYSVIELHEPLAWVTCLLWPNIRKVVLSHGLEENSYATLLAHGLESPSRLRSLWLHASLFGPIRLACRAADAVLVLNEKDARYLSFRTPKLPISIYANGVTPIKESTRLRSPLGGDPIRFLYLGSWIPRKGAEVLIAAAVLARDVRVDVYGDLTQGALPSSVADKIEVHGAYSREMLPSILSSHEVLILPSYFEGMPLVLLEAMSAGLVIIGTRIGGVEDVLGDEGGVALPAGLMFEPGDAAQLANLMQELIKDPGLVATYRERSEVRASQFTWEASARMLQSAYLGRDNS